MRKLIFRFSFIFILLFSQSEAFAASGVKAQYVRIQLNGDNLILSLSEVEVYSNSVNVALNGSATQVSTLNNAQASRAIDGNQSGIYSKGSVSHTRKGHNPWWQLDLGSMYDVDKIKIYNRTDCCMDRLDSAKVILLDSNYEVVWSDKVRGNDIKYEFIVNNLNDRNSFISNNLLRNPTFKQQTISKSPDYWGIHNSASRTLKENFGYYGIVDDVQTPIIGASVLKMSNLDPAYHHLMLVPMKLYNKLPNGKYTFSIYIKASNSSSRVVFKPRLRANGVRTENLTTKWKRYSVTFNFNDNELTGLQPVIRFPDKGTYYIAAPQLEAGIVATEFKSSYEDFKNYGLATIKRKVRDVTNNMLGLFYDKRTPLYSTFFEFNYYTDDKYASIVFSSNDDDNDNLSDVVCSDSDLNIFYIKKNIHNAKIVDIPIKHLKLGEYSCDVKIYQDNSLISEEVLGLNKIKPNIREVRVNNKYLNLYINNVPYYIIGLSSSGGTSLPDWYLNEVKNNGINTLFVHVLPDKSGNYDIQDIKEFLSRVDKFKLKVVLGLPLSGHKNKTWILELNKFEELINKIKNNLTVIGWWPIDEPSSSWSDDDIKLVYSQIKKIDPYRFVMVNWGYAAIPVAIGQEPRGTLSATDIYSIDYYPHGKMKTMNGYTDITLKMLKTSRIYNKLSHSWLQLYGFDDVWREPTGDELNYMAYFNFIHRSMFSYWGGVPSAISIWKRVGSINSEIKQLSEFLILDSNARFVESVDNVDGFTYSLWKKSGHVYLIVLHDGSESSNFSFDFKKYFPNKPLINVKSFFNQDIIPSNNGVIDIKFMPFERQVYVVE